MHHASHTRCMVKKQQPFNGPLSGNIQVGRYQKKHSHILTPILIIKHPLSTSSTKIHSILLVQFMCLAVLFHNLCPRPLWSSTWSGTLYFILHTSPNHLLSQYHCINPICTEFQYPLWAVAGIISATSPDNPGALCFLPENIIKNY